MALMQLVAYINDISNIYHDNSIDDHNPFSPSEILTLSPSNFNQIFFEYNISNADYIITDCSLICPTIPPGFTTISFILNGYIIDEFRIDQNFICMKFRDCAINYPTTIPLKTFFNKHPQNFLPANHVSNITIRVTNSGLDKNTQLLLNITRTTQSNGPFKKLIEQHGTYVHQMNNEWIEFREAYNTLRVNQKHFVFRTKQMVQHIMSFIRPSKPPVQVKERIKLCLPCNLPLTELYWFAKCNDKIIKMFDHQSIILNEYTRQKGDSTFFEHITTWSHYNNRIPNVSIYPFVVHPTQFHNEGHLHSSRIDQFTLELDVEYSGRQKYEIVVGWTAINVICYDFGAVNVAFSN